MGTASLQFLLFSLCVTIIFNVSRSRIFRQTVLLLASLAFLSFFSHNPAAWLPLTFFLAAGYTSIRLMQNARTRTVFVPLIIGIIALFVWLKKYTFIPSALLLNQPYVTIGLSYIFFRVLHLVIDAKDDQELARISLVSYLNYTLNFTTLISGPIQRYQEFARCQLAAVPLELNIRVIGSAIQRVIIGFFKVNVLSLALSSLQSAALHKLTASLPLADRVLQGSIVVAIYPLYLYCNFSGYIDMVIGIARLLRMTLPENFNRPFSSVNFMIFWSRWHITLSQWLKDYVYNPLLLTARRRYPSAVLAPYLGALAIFITFFLVGVWHGQTSVFLFFGVLQGLGVAVAQFYGVVMTQRLGKKRFKILSDHPILAALSRGLTFTWFAFTLLWFWSNWGQIGDLAHRLSPAGITATLATILLFSTLVLAAWESGRTLILGVQINCAPVVHSRYVRTVVVTAAAVIALVTVVILNAPAPDIVYKTF